MITVAVCFFSAGTTYGARVDMFACHRSNQVNESRPVAGINSKANKKKKKGKSTAETSDRIEGRKRRC